MSEAAMMPEPMEDPKEKSLAVELASIQITFTAPSMETLGILSSDDLNQFKESLVKPSFVRDQLEIEKRFGDVLEVRNIEVREGSIILEALLFTVIAVGNTPIAVGAAGGILTAIVIKNIYTPSEKIQYQDLMQKISAIIQGHVENISGGDFEIAGASIPIYNPKLKNYRLEKFEFHSKDIDKLQKDVEKAIDNYHKIIGKP